LARYAVGSLSASVVSAILLTSLSWHHTVAPAVATVIAFVAGALVNFSVFRFWAWRHTLIPEAGAVGRDFAKFSAVAVVTALIAAGTTTLAGRYADHAGFSSAQRSLLIDGCYFGAFAVMFLLKFLILDRFVFNEHRQPDSESAHVEHPAAAVTTPATVENNPPT
jgi:putative flippase GtrA